jgi:benzoate transport
VPRFQPLPRTGQPTAPADAVLPKNTHAIGETMENSTLREKIDDRPMSRYQWVIVAVATVLMMMEGYDVQAMAFTASAVTEDLGLTGAELGLLLSGGLIGMALGTAGVGPFADRHGRRPVLLVAMAVTVVGLFLTAMASSLPEMLAWRVITGLGIGGTMTSGVVLVSEYANSKYRALALSIYSSGFPIGATLGGLAAVPLINSFGWQGVFTVGGIATALAIAGVALFVPESIDHLAAKFRSGRTQALQRAEKIALRLKVAGPVVLSAARDGGETRRRNAYATLLSRENRKGTLMLWAIYFMVMASFYFVSSWTPRLLTETGLTAEQGIFGGLVVMAGGLVGNVLYGSCAARWDARKVMACFAVVSALLMVAFVSTTSTLFLALAMGLLLGVFINGCMAALYTIAPMTYSADLRSTGVGTAMGFGRVGSILSPIAVGGLLDIGWTPIALYVLLAVIILLAAGIVPRLPSRQNAVGQGGEAQTGMSPAARDTERQEAGKGQP